MKTHLTREIRWLLADDSAVDLAYGRSFMSMSVARAHRPS